MEAEVAVRGTASSARRVGASRAGCRKSFRSCPAKRAARCRSRTIRDALGDRSFAALLLFFAIINLIPLPPGTSALLGLPLLIVSAQMVYGSKRVWLPRVLVDRTVSAETFRVDDGPDHPATGLDRAT